MPDDASPNPSTVGDCCRAALSQGTGLRDADDVGRLISIEVDTPGFPKTLEAIGLRNPFGFSVDPGSQATGQGAGDVWIGDTGELHAGSIVHWIPGTGPLENYGCPWQERSGAFNWSMPSSGTWGPAGCNASGGCPETTPAPTYTTAGVRYFADALEFSGSVTRDAIIGGHVYRNSTVPSLQDRYVFATFGAFTLPRIYSFSAPVPLTGAPTNHSSGLGMTAANGWVVNDAIHAIGIDSDGELLVVGVDDNLTLSTPAHLGNGSVWRITPRFAWFSS